MLTVYEVDEVDEELERAVAALIPQLSQSATPPDRDQLAALVASPVITLFGVRDGTGPMVGMLTLALVPTPTGLRAWIEDVVVDATAGGQGAGTALTRAALDAARRAGARTVDLTSRPSREAANRLYQRIGFERRETNVYRYHVD